MRPILIQGALDIEVENFLSKMENKKQENFVGFEFYTGSINGVNVVISKTLIGVVNSTLATTIGIYNFHPSLVINQGIAGAHREFIHVGDIIIGEKCCNVNSYNMPVKDEGMGSNPFEWKPNERAKDVKSADPNLVDSIYNLLKDKSNIRGNVYKGILGCGDLFSREYDRIKWINSTFSNDSEDMESIGCYSVCEKFKIPCVGIRIISNNELTREESDRSTAIDLQKYLVKILDKIFKDCSKNITI